MPRKMLKLTFRDTIQYSHSWEFGWGTANNTYKFIDIMATVPFTKGSLPEYLARQYGRCIINKIKFVIDEYDMTRAYAAVTKPISDRIEGLIADPYFDRSRLYLTFFPTNDRDMWKSLELSEGLEYVKRVPYGKKYVHTFYPRCKNSSILNAGILTKSLHDMLVDMSSPYNGREGLYMGFAPVPSFPNASSASDYQRYDFAFTLKIIFTMTFSHVNPEKQF